jgi:hypothetical protein
VGDKEVESNVTGWDTDSVYRALTAALWLEVEEDGREERKNTAIQVPKRQETQLAVLRTIRSPLYTSTGDDVTMTS